MEYNRICSDLWAAITALRLGGEFFDWDHKMLGSKKSSMDPIKSMIHDDPEVEQDSLMASTVIGSDNASKSDMGSGGGAVAMAESTEGMSTAFTPTLITELLSCVGFKAWSTPWILFNTPLQACGG